jgi:hypothetical protein
VLRPTGASAASLTTLGLRKSHWPIRGLLVGSSRLGSADLADATDALPRGTLFLAKPHLPDELVRTVQQTLAERAG